jgi:hypothetical protein
MNIEGFTKVQVSSFVRMKLKTSIKWAKAGCLALYQLQTPNEQRIHLTVEDNGVGFSAFDAPLLTHIACKLRRNRSLTSFENRALKDRIHHYWDQMVEVSDPKILKVHLDDYYKGEDE